MAWNDEMVTMLRVLINDLEAPETYTDARLKQVLVVAAIYVQQEIDSSIVYTIDVGTPDISPDPTDDPRDDVFINFTVLKAACMIDLGELRLQALRAGVEARCGPAWIRVANGNKAFALLLEEGPCATYEQLKMEYLVGNANAVKAVLSPFIGNRFDPVTLNTYPPFREGAMFE